MTKRPVRPIGQPTRGKTALNRLRQIDVYVALAMPSVLSSGAPLVVDVGFGAYAWTTLEMRQRWLHLNRALRVLGIEIDPERVEAALHYADPPAINFRLGGFNVLDITHGEPVRLIRAYNVLRQYSESEVPAALDLMGQALESGGVLIEGTSNPTGRLVAFDVYRKDQGGLQHQALVFGTNFQGPVEPSDFKAILPKRLIHRMLEPAPSTFFATWNDAYRLARGQGHSGRRQWARAGILLKERFGYPVDPRLRLLRRGFLTLQDRLYEPEID
jgi:hypothetical protein